jgi:hypothetical protein
MIHQKNVLSTTHSWPRKGKIRGRIKPTIAGGSDGVKTNAIGLVLLGVNAGGEDTVGLSLPVGELACMCPK